MARETAGSLRPRTNLSPLELLAEETADDCRLSFLGRGRFRSYGLLLLLIGTADFGLLLRGFLLVGFRGFVAHKYGIVVSTNCSACGMEVSPRVGFIMRGAEAYVNAGRKNFSFLFQTAADAAVGKFVVFSVDRLLRP